MEYMTLKKKYYQIKNPEQFEIFYQSRLNGECSVKSGLMMYPFNKRLEVRDRIAYEIFYSQTRELALLKESVYTYSKKIELLLNELPAIAKQHLFLNTLINELQGTNEIEGVKSTRKELGDAVSNVLSKNKNERRFTGLVKQYLKFMDSKYNSIKNVEEFRSIWDELVGEEEKEDIPDGDMFRKSSVEIKDGENGKVIHRGDTDEQNIKVDLEKLVLEMNNKEIPSLEKCFMAHYFYEYVHPFYDGNGRTGRFIVCSYLSRKLDMMSAITFSATIANNKEYYYKAFTNMSESLNRAEATFFIKRMLKIVIMGQKQIIDEIIEGTDRLNKAYELIRQCKLNDLENEVLYMLFQQYIFGNYVDNLADKEISDVLNKSRHVISKTMNNLENKGYVDIKSKRPKRHIISNNLKERFEKEWTAY